MEAGSVEPGLVVTDNATVPTKQGYGVTTIYLFSRSSLERGCHAEALVCHLSFAARSFDFALIVMIISFSFSSRERNGT